MTKQNFKLWIKAALVRAVKTTAQTAVALIGVGTVMSDIDWLMVGSASLLAGILSILTSVAGLPEIKDWYNNKINKERKETKWKKETNFI